MSAHARQILAAIAVLALSGAGAARAADQSNALGKNLAGESCGFGATAGAASALRTMPI